MFEIGWSEILVIAIVLIVVVGPKDLPKMLRAFGKATSRFRATAGEFRRQFDEALKEAELDDVREIINDAKSLDPRNDIRKVFDPVRTIGEEIRSSLNDPAPGAKDNVAIPDPGAPGAEPSQPQVAQPATAAGQAAEPVAAAGQVPEPATATGQVAEPAAPAKKPAARATARAAAKTAAKPAPAAKATAKPKDKPAGAASTRTAKRPAGTGSARKKP
ncbi:Sec-independent protein translocase protein TatB [Phyllobacterium sp. 0TCS1.6C]|uniref:Sec-independent protein translocase protein TatB n=1 Tax=unclassified Phyllobacterium TaxID=2638441 RepID=UPI0022645D36|nr:MULTISPECIES: Sec-independent protein translocase protein TatB [unclassified Phyllobacterium]MCX8280802.1 Sec-independent protein translocase protein TatB [Phyllobacterium sp. 0TCS1.6C]MCX8292621.1 Sec-independent protein translocase protein TatB [Phyllobacterium sp. 0TCS1.6A]